MKGDPHSLEVKMADLNRNKLAEKSEIFADSGSEDECRAANHYVLAVVCYAQGHCTMLMIISLCSPSEKQKLFMFDPMHLCGHQIHQQLVACVPFCV